jgi:ribosome-associated translation inhibitor RaiA
MALTTSVTFKGMPSSPALRSDIESHAEKLLKFAPRLQTCSVVVSYNEHRHQRGNQYLVHVHLTMPGGSFESGKISNTDFGHEDPYLAVRDTFDALRRQVEDHVRIQRGDVKKNQNAEH